MRCCRNWREPRKAAPRPDLRKVLRGDVEERRILGAWDQQWCSRGSDPPIGSGVAANLSLPPCYVGDRNRGEHIARLMRCPEAARLKWTVRDQTGRPVCEIAALSVTEKAPEQSGKADARVAPRKRSTLLVWGPGAGVEAAGRLWFGHNKPGVASIPQFAAKLFWRELL